MMDSGTKDPQAEWDFYFCTVEEHPASIMLDLALHTHAPLSDKINFLQLAVDLQAPNDFGLTTTGEAEVLYILEDKLSEHILENLGGLYVARNTTNGQRIFYYYCQTSIDYKSIVEEVMERFADYEYTVKIQRDPSWAFYQQFLFPSKWEYQSILNRRVIEKLEQQGDNLQAAREVEHYFFFPQETHLTKFLEEIKEENFQILSRKFDDQKTPETYSLVISREEKIDASAIDDVVIFLMQLAEKCQGEYDGWGTGVVQV
ncbi:MAG: DUF695 domain-containing protein [Bacteroidota bacterium]